MAKADYTRQLSTAIDLLTGAQARMGETGRDLAFAEKAIKRALDVVQACRQHEHLTEALADAVDNLSTAQGAALEMRKEG